MPLTSDDLDALRLLMREEIDQAFAFRLDPFREEVSERFREVDRRFEGLYAQDEKREQEYLFIREQLGRVETRLERVESDVKVIRDVVERHDDDLEDLKKKRA